jgi:hypothetical protein
MENENNTELIKECTGDIIISICNIGNAIVALNILNNYYIDEDYDILYKFINVLLGISLAYPYYILFTKYIKFYIKYKNVDHQL